LLLPEPAQRLTAQRRNTSDCRSTTSKQPRRTGPLLRQHATYCCILSLTRVSHGHDEAMQEPFSTAAQAHRGNAGSPDCITKNISDTIHSPIESHDTKLRSINSQVSFHSEMVIAPISSRPRFTRAPSYVTKNSSPTTVSSPC
jgi:hypothetical protein